MLTSIDKAYQRLPPLSIISGWRLPRNPSTSRYRNRHNPSTSWHRNRPENIIFPFIPSSIPCFCQRLHIPPPPLCAIKQSKKRKKKSSSPSLKRDSENVYLCFSRSTRFRGWIGYDCSITVILHVCSCSCFSTKKRGLKKRKNHYYRPCINESSFVHSLLLMWFVVFLFCKYSLKYTQYQVIYHIFLFFRGTPKHSGWYDMSFFLFFSCWRLIFLFCFFFRKTQTYSRYYLMSFFFFLNQKYTGIPAAIIETCVSLYQRYPKMYNACNMPLIFFGDIEKYTRYIITLVTRTW